LSEDFTQRVNDVLQRALQGMAAYGALRAYKARIAAAAAIRAALQPPAARARLVRTGTLGSGIVVPDVLTVSDAHGFTLSFSLDSRVSYIGGTIVPTPTLEDFTMLMDNHRVVCRGDECSIVSNDLKTVARITPVTANDGVAMMAKWYRVEPVEGAVPPLRLVNGDERLVVPTCIGLVLGRYAERGMCPDVAVERTVGDQTVTYTFPGCLAATDGENTYYIVEGLGYYATVEGVTPSICSY